MADIKIGLIGAGTVGSGVVKIMNKQSSFFQEKLGLPVKLARIADRDLEKLKTLPTGDAICTGEASDVINDPEINVVIELIGGYTFAKDVVIESLKKGKHVITANKALIAKFGPELFGIAKEFGGSIHFEAAVGGGMPSIKTIREAMIGNDVRSVYTIINGTCNYILTEMTEKGAAFEPTLKEAQRLGFAEANPALDIEGGDTGHKTAIIASLIYDGYCDYDKVPVRGITEISADDIISAKELGYTIKLLGVIKRKDGEEAVDVRVNPVMLHNDHILASVNGVFNAVLLEGDAVGPILLYGAGAGEMPTASAVVSDIIDVARNIKSGDTNRIPMHFYALENELTIKGITEIESRFYLRFAVEDKPGVLADIAEEFGKRNISIASVMHKEAHDGNDFVPVIITTDMAIESDLRDAVAAIEAKAFTHGKTQIIHIED